MLVKPHGLKGHLVFKAIPSVLHQVSSFKSVFLTHHGAKIPYLIEHIARLNKDLVKLKLTGVDDQQSAEGLRGTRVFQLNSLLDLDKQIDLIGFTVRHANDEIVGEIVAVNDSTAQTLLEVINGDEDYFIPLVEAFIDRIDEVERTIWMDLPDGILDV